VNVVAALHKRLDSAVALPVSLIAGRLIDHLWTTAIQGTTERRIRTTP
jgi:hypothetical protein